MFQRIAILITLALVLVSKPLSAQGIFEPVAFANNAISTGQAELLSPIQILLRSGTTVPGTLVIDVSPLRIANTASNIQVTFVGGFSLSAAVTVQAEEGRVRVPITGTVTSGSIRVEGIRVVLAGTNVTSVTARLSWEGLNFVHPTNSVVAINSVKTGLLADPITDRFVISSGIVVDNTASIVAREGFESAFTDSTRFGQTTATQIRFRISDMPSGLTMRFPAAVNAGETSAGLTTLEGADVLLPRTDGGMEVTYRFTSAATSSVTLETFNISFTVAVQGALGTRQPTIEVSLAPIGAATTLPLTTIPLFAEENLTVLEGSSRIVSKILYWTGIDGARENRVFLANPSTAVANLTLDVFNAAGQLIAGSNITNPAQLSLAANQSADRTLTGLFGSSAAGIATFRVRSTSADVLGLATMSSTGLMESVPLLSQAIPSFTTAVSNEGTRIHIFNPASAAATGTLLLKDASGATASSRILTVGPMASVTHTLPDLFAADINGYVVGTFDQSIIVFKTFGPATSLNADAVRAPVSAATMYVPYFASGSGYVSEVNIINRSDDTVTILAERRDPAGNSVSPSSLITLPPSTQVKADVSNIFPLPAGLVTGYIRLVMPLSQRGPFVSYPSVQGEVRLFTPDSSASTLIPLSAYPLQDGYILASGSAPGSYQGIVLVNPSDTPATAALQVLDSLGSVTQTASVTLNPGQEVARVVTELFSASIPEGSLIRVTGSTPLVVTSITGTHSLDQLRSSPSLR